MALSVNVGKTADTAFLIIGSKNFPASENIDHKLALAPGNYSNLFLVNKETSFSNFGLWPHQTKGKPFFARLLTYALAYIKSKSLLAETKDYSTY